MASLGRVSAASEKHGIEQHRDNRLKDRGGGHDEALARAPEIAGYAHQSQGEHEPYGQERKCKGRVERAEMAHLLADEVRELVHGRAELMQKSGRGEP
jgi:hypothetical protein